MQVGTILYILFLEALARTLSHFGVALSLDFHLPMWGQLGQYQSTEGSIQPLNILQTESLTLLNLDQHLIGLCKTLYMNVANMDQFSANSHYISTLSFLAWNTERIFHTKVRLLDMTPIHNPMDVL